VIYMANGRADHALQELRAAYRRSEIIQSCYLLAQFDQMTVMPLSGSAHRAEQLTYLAKLRHDCLADPRIAEWLDAVEQSPCKQEPDVAATVRVIRMEHEFLARVPTGLAVAINDTSAEAVGAWRAAREDRDFEIYRPFLDEMIRLKREEADVLRDGRCDTVSRHDVYLGFHDPGVTTQEYQAALATLHTGLRP